VIEAAKKRRQEPCNVVPTFMSNRLIYQFSAPTATIAFALPIIVVPGFTSHTTADLPKNVVCAATNR
jgi:hypothetical protein